MPMYEGFFDHKDEDNSHKFMLRILARDESEAKEAFAQECPDTHEMTAIALKNGHSRSFTRGRPLNTIEHAMYARTQRLLPPTDENLEKFESALEVSSKVKGPSLDDLKKRHPTPAAASLINVFGILLSVVSTLIGLYLFNLNGGAIKALAMTVIPGIVTGLLLIAVAWSMKTLNRIAIASEYQAKLSEYQHQNRHLAERGV